MTTRPTNRWVGVSALVFAAGAAGVFLGRPALLLVGVVGVGYVGYVRIATPPPVDVEIARDVDDPEPDPGDRVAVTLSVTNAGERTIPDLRLVDGVPDRLEVPEGTARLGTALRPGETDETTYAIEARRGVHAFDATTVIARDWTGAVERVVERTASTELICVPTFDALPGFRLRPQTADYAGRERSDLGGSGVEFYATRQYRHGDPLSRIDWKRRARTGELATIEFHEERAVHATIVLDVREENYAGDADNELAVDHAVEAAGQVANTLLDAGNRVGIAGFGPTWVWVPPRLGRAHRVEIDRTLGVHDAFSPYPPTGRFLPMEVIPRLRTQLPADAQVVFVSPFLDDYALVATRRIEAHGHPVTVVSPDVTDAGTAGGKVAGLERADRLRRARDAGTRVLDWDPDEPLMAAVERGARRWRG